MPRATHAGATHRRRRRMLKATRGYFGNKSRLFRYAREAWRRAGQFAYRDRRKRKTEMRQLWIVRLNAACRPFGLPYCRFIAGLKAAQIQLDRKSLSELALHDPEAFARVVTRVREVLPGITPAEAR
ncbi:MAG: 50S ribosomal protein L20 [Puniceicoccales bacterium]|nr:50S ribosomal protein L20 [Puniceicoccales bacterium]